MTIIEIVNWWFFEAIDFTRNNLLMVFVVFTWLIFRSWKKNDKD